MRLALAAACFLVCCTPLTAQESGTIVFYREPHAMTGYFKPAVYCDGEELATLENGTSFEVTATAGVHTCAAESPQSPGAIEVNVVAGKSAYVHVNLLKGLTRHASLANTTEDEYEKQKPKLKPVKEWTRNAIGKGAGDAGTSPAKPQTGNKPPEERHVSEGSGDSGPAPAKPQTGSKSPKDKHAGRFGDLAVSVTKVEMVPTHYQKDRDVLAAFVSVQNTGKDVVCANLAATLNTTFGLQYLGGGGDAPRMNEMLPGELVTGSYVFNIKDGVEPLELVIRLTSKQYTGGSATGTIRCGSNSPLRDVLIPDEIHLDVHDLMIAKPSR